MCLFDYASFHSYPDNRECLSDFISLILVCVVYSPCFSRLVFLSTSSFCVFLHVNTEATRFSRKGKLISAWIFYKSLSHFLPPLTYFPLRNPNFCRCSLSHFFTLVLALMLFLFPVALAEIGETTRHHFSDGDDFVALFLRESRFE